MKAGRWPSAYNECVVVLTANGTVPDLVSYALGLRDHAVLEDMIDQFMNEEDVESPDDIPHVHLRRDHGRVAEDGARRRLLHL